MPHYSRKIDNEIKSALGAIDEAEKIGVNQFLKAVDTMREKILIAILEQDINPMTIEQIKSRINGITDTFNAQFKDLLSENQRRQFIRGIQVVDRAISSGNLRQAVPYLDEKLLNTLRNYGANLITNLTDDARKKIAQAIDLASMGEKPTWSTIREIGRNLKDPSIFGTIARRAETIMRTESMRISQLATVERIKQYQATIPDLKKEWLHSHLGFPRVGHLRLDGVIIKANDKFKLIGEDGIVYMISAPNDPLLPPSETINCRCKVLPVIGRYEKQMEKRPAWTRITPDEDKSPIMMPKEGKEPPVPITAEKDAAELINKLAEPPKKMDIQAKDFMSDEEQKIRLKELKDSPYYNDIQEAFDSLISKPDLKKQLELNNISPEDFAFIRGYTIDVYRRLNKGLLGKKLDKVHRLWADGLKQALKKYSKTFEGTTYRGLNFGNDEKRYKNFMDSLLNAEGKIVETQSFWSSTTDIHMTTFFAGSSKYSARMIIKSKSGRYIRDISANRHEEEVLFNIGTRFKVLDVKRNYDNERRDFLTEIFLQEI